MDYVFSAFSNRLILEKIIILFVTAGISGLIITLAISYLDKKSAMRQKVIDEARAQQQKENDLNRIRNEAILASQAQLLKDFSDVALTYATLALDVSWFGSTNMCDRDRYERH